MTHRRGGGVISNVLASYLEFGGNSLVWNMWVSILVNYVCIHHSHFHAPKEYLRHHLTDLCRKLNKWLRNGDAGGQKQYCDTGKAARDVVYP